MKIRAIIIDDELPARTRLKNYLKEYPEITIIGEAQDGKEAVSLINKSDPDLIFLDIQMPDMDGFKVLEKINNKISIIFVTAYDEYAIKAFEVNAIDYLLKPYSKERFKSAINRGISNIKKKEQTENIISLLEFIKKKKSYLDRITIKNDSEFEILKVEDIDFFRVESGIVFLYSGNNKCMIDVTISQLEKRLNPKIFYRTHRNSIVNLMKIYKMDVWGQGKYVIKFANNERIFISRDRIKKFKQLMGIKLK